MFLPSLKKFDLSLFDVGKPFISTIALKER